MNIKPDIINISGPRPGATVAVIAGIHGNETTGVLALQKLLPKLKLKRGQLIVIYANPPALAAGVRQIGKNLNRCFTVGNTGSSYEDRRARKIMNLLGACQASLDLHAYNEPTGQPFVMTETVGLEPARIFDVPIISTNWAAEEPGTTDAYMCLQGKVGLCLECGPIAEAKQYVEFAKQSVLQFLQFYGLVEAMAEFSTTTKRVIEARDSLVRTSQDYWLDPSLVSFQKLKPGQKFARHGGHDYVASGGEYIIFPRPQAALGAEAFILGQELT